jgi:phosphate transport system substrate-binding protein
MIKYKMNRTFIYSFLVICLLTIGCNNNSGNNKKNKLEGQVTISGAFALYPIATLWAEEFMKIYPAVRIDISAGGAGKGMTDVLSEMVDLAMVSRSISPEEIKRGAWVIAVVKDAVVSTVNANNPYIDSIRKHGLTKQEFKAVYIDGTISDWKKIFSGKQSTHIQVFTRSDACGAGEMWGKYFGHNQEALLGVGVYGDPGIADAVKRDPASIGFNNVIYAYNISTRKVYDGMEVVPVDLNENGIIDQQEDFYYNLDSLTNAIREGIYPSPPARELFFVSKGNPEKTIIKEFLKWILTDGQKYIGQAGYVELSENKRLAELSKVK